MKNKFSLLGQFLVILFSTLDTIPIIAQDSTIQLSTEGYLQMKEGAVDGYLLQSDATGWSTWVKPAYLQRKEIDVTNFGAIADFNADNTAAFQAAIDSAAIIGAVVHIPAGNYILTNQLEVPDGVVLEGESVGGDYHDFAHPVRGSCLIYTGQDYVAVFQGYFSGAKNLYVYNGNSAGSKATGCFKVLADDGHFSTGYNSFSNLYLYNFFEGTCLQLLATNNSTIAHVKVEDVLFRFPGTGMHILAESGSTIQHITLLNGKIGGGRQYSFRNQGGTNINVYGTSFEGIRCNSYGHVVVESGNINMYGFKTESTDSEGTCDVSEIPSIHFYPNTQGSYIQGFIGDGRVIDEGANHLNVNGKNIGFRSSGYNAFINSGLNGVQNQNIPYWEISGSVDEITTSKPIFQDRHQVVELSIPAGAIVRFSPNDIALPKDLNHQFASFGAYIKTAISNQTFASSNSYTNTCNSTNSTFHPGDNDWHFISLPIRLHGTDCLNTASFVIDNSNNPSPSIVSITCPSFAFGNARPSLLSSPLLKAGGIMNGTLSTNMMNFPILVNHQLELTLPPDANTFLLTGTNSIHRLNNNLGLGKRFPKGTVLNLIFDSPGVTVKNGAYINLLGTADYTSTLGSSLSLVALEVGVWRELSRNF